MHSWVHVQNAPESLSVQNYQEFTWYKDNLDIAGVCKHCDYVIDDWEGLVTKHVLFDCEKIPLQRKRLYDYAGYLTPFNGYDTVLI